MFEDIITAIEQEKCILVLGPELCHFEGKSFDTSIKEAYDRYYEQLPPLEKMKIGNQKIEFVNYPFLMEELMSHNSEMAEIHIHNFVKVYFRQRREWTDYYKQIAALPIPLIISLLPDDNLQNAFNEVYPDSFDVSSYSRKNENLAKINDKPTSKKPLIYKLLGDMANNNYDVNFTFTDWFSYFKNIFGKKPLPVEILSLLNENPVIIFLGVRFEKWYVQLLIRLLVSDESGKLRMGNRFSFSHIVEQGLETLVWNRFSLNAEQANPVDFLNTIYKQCKEKGMLRVAESSKEKINATVFISYNHHNTAIAERVKIDLEAYGITVIIDQDNPVGFSIPEFIGREMDKSDLILALISKTFLTSAWVAVESLTTIWANKKVLPCYVDNALFDENFRDEAFDLVEEKKQAIGKRINDRRSKGFDSRDLTDIEERLLDLKNNLAKIIKFFQNKNSANLCEENYEEGFAQVIKSIKKQIAS